MKKGIALVLLLILTANSVLWAQENTYSFLESPGFIALVVALALTPLLIWWVVDSVAEADAPDDGLMLVSSQNSQTMPQVNSAPVMNVLQHVVADYNTQENKVYMGLRFRF
jgi:hypothetical protein